LTPGKGTVRFEFAYDGGGPAKGGTGTLLVNGRKVAEGRIERTQCCMFSADEGTDVGADEGTPVTEDYQVPFKFTGWIDKITIGLPGMNETDMDEAEKASNAAAISKGLSD
jgi:arylsulfatase